MNKNTDSKIDDYIEASAPFAKPILTHLRQLIHEACPAVEEKIKWGFPHFDYKGVYLSMAAFKEHCAFTFWKASIMDNPHGLFGEKTEKAMGQFGKIRSLADLPPDETLFEYLLQAKQLNDEGKKPDRKPVGKDRPALVIPKDLGRALEKDPLVMANFDCLPWSHRKEYIEWISEAKTPATREKRIRTTVEWVAEKRHRNWKYQ
jgi:uncharacterized protein YdeI (YjbR/CyaY-like superfamily)